MQNEKYNGNYSGDPSKMRKAPGYTGPVPGVNSPNMELPGSKTNPEIVPPAFNPPVPNRAWTAMRAGLDIEALSEEEKRELYYGKDDIL